MANAWYVGTVSSTGNSTWQPIPMGQPTAKDRDYEYDNWDEKPKERSENMRTLYRITVVNPKTEEIEETLLVIAKDKEGALLKAPFTPAIRANSDQYDFLFEVVGDVRAKKDVQKVKVVKEDDES